MKSALFVVLLLLASGCSDASSDTTTMTPTSSTTTPGAGTEEPATTTTTAVEATAESTTTEAPVFPPSIEGTFEVESLDIVGGERLVAIADTPDLRNQGLMFVEEMGDLDGMLFVFQQDSTGGFWMKNTLIQLDIAFFDSEGAFVDGFEMEPCTTSTCPSYEPSGAYRYALEMAAGDMPDDVAEIGLGQPVDR